MGPHLLCPAFMGGAKAQNRERGQAVVETALVLPLQLFCLLGLMQLAMSYQARLVGEYAAYKTARAASLYRLDCDRVTRAARLALLPTISRTTPRMMVNQPPSAAKTIDRYREAVNQVMAANQPPNNPEGVGTPLVVVDLRMENPSGLSSFDVLLEPGEQPMKVYVRLIYFHELRLPFVNNVMARTWLMGQTGLAWRNGYNPLSPANNVSLAHEAPLHTFLDGQLISIAQNAIARGYYTTPIITSFALRMMSDPIPGNPLVVRCM
jgi:hypothetical protein